MQTVKVRAVEWLCLKRGHYLVSLKNRYQIFKVILKESWLAWTMLWIFVRDVQFFIIIQKKNTANMTIMVFCHSYEESFLIEPGSNSWWSVRNIQCSSNKIVQRFCFRDAYQRLGKGAHIVAPSCIASLICEIFVDSKDLYICDKYAQDKSVSVNFLNYIHVMNTSFSNLLIKNSDYNMPTLILTIVMP